MSKSINAPGHSDEFVRAPLTYPGNKTELAEEIIACIPEHETYVEPFGGTAGVLFNKEPSRNEVINDINSDITTFMRVLRDDVEELVEWLRATPYSESEYDRLKERWHRGKRPDDDVVHAGQLFFLRRASFGGDMTGFRAVAHGRKNSARQFSNARDRLLSLSDRLDGVLIRNTDWQSIIEQYASPDTFFYCDPPYRGKRHYYDGEFSPMEFELYFIRHMDGTPNSEIDRSRLQGPFPPAFTELDQFSPSPDTLYPIDELPVTDFSVPTVEKGGTAYVRGEHLEAEDLYRYGSEHDPIRFAISSDGPIDGLNDYTWTLRLDEYTHEINNYSGNPREAAECLTTNYNPNADDFQPFTGGNTSLSAFE